MTSNWFGRWSKSGASPTSRKKEHIAVSLTKEVQAPWEVGWSDVYLPHQALPEINLDEVDLSAELCGCRFRYPLMISALTGGHRDAVPINQNLAKAAAYFGIGMELGSQTPLVDMPQLEYTYSVAREVAPDAFLVANISAARLINQGRNAAYTLEQIERFIQVIRADALAIHLNFLQEAVMPEGDVKARGCLEAISRIIQAVPIPVIAKETGAGISKAQASKLKDAGVSVLDIGGAGGTSMALVESYRAQMRRNPKHHRLGLTFAQWGIPTVISLLEAKSSGLPLIASGGITNGLEAAKALALGANLVGVARPLLHAASKSYDAVREWLEVFFAELAAAVFLSASASLSDLRSKQVVVLGKSREWLNQLGYSLGAAE